MLLHCTHGMHRTALVWCLHELTRTGRVPFNECAASGAGQNRAASSSLTHAGEATSRGRLQPVPAGASSSRAPVGDAPRESGVAAALLTPGPRAHEESGQEGGRGGPSATMPVKRKAQDGIEIQSSGPRHEEARKRRRVEGADSDRPVPVRVAMNVLKDFQSARGCRFQWPLESLAETLALAALASNRKRGGSI